MALKGQIPWNKGIARTQETRDKISNSLKGRPSWNKGKKCPQLSGSSHWLSGKKQSDEVKKKISTSLKGRPSAKKGRSYPHLQGENSSSWKTGRYESKGYVHIRKRNHPRANNGYVLEHRLVTEKHLGRYLKPWEVVHHKNGIKNDNRLENLTLLSGSEEHNTQVEKIYMQNKKLKIKVGQLEEEILVLRMVICDCIAHLF